MKHVLIVIPTYNEAENVKPLVANITKMAAKQPKYKFDILFIDGNSPDGTADIIKKLKLPLGEIYLLKDAKAGLGKAYRQAFKYGLTLKSYFALVTMDADLSHDPADIPCLLAKLKRGTSYVIGSRYVRGGRSADGYSLFRRSLSLAANFLAKRLMDLKPEIHDTTSGFKAIQASALTVVTLNDIDASGYVFQVSLLYKFVRLGYGIAEVPITFQARQHGRSKLGLADIVEFLRQVYALNPDSRPRRFIRFGTVGAIGAVVNLLLLSSLISIFRLSVMMSYLLALEGSIICNFWLNHRFTFQRVDAISFEPAKSVSAHLSKLWRYNLVALGGAAIAWLTFSLSYLRLGTGYVIADILGIALATAWNYRLSVQLVWRIFDDTPANEVKIQGLQKA